MKPAEGKNKIFMLIRIRQPEVKREFIEWK